MPSIGVGRFVTLYRVRKGPALIAGDVLRGGRMPRMFWRVRMGINIRKGTDSIIVKHSVKEGTREIFVRTYEMLISQSIGHYEMVLVLRHKAPRERHWRYMYAIPCGYAYLTVEKEGKIVYDSRSEIPCNMEQFKALHALMKESGYLDSSYGQPNTQHFREMLAIHHQFEDPKPKKRHPLAACQPSLSPATPAGIIDLETMRSRKRGKS